MGVWARSHANTTPFYTRDLSIRRFWYPWGVLDPIPHGQQGTTVVVIVLHVLQQEQGASQVLLVVKNPPANAGDIRNAGSIPGSGRSPEGGNGNPPQYSCLENPMDREAWWATVHKIAKSQTRLKRLSTQAQSLYRISPTFQRHYK